MIISYIVVAVIVFILSLDVSIERQWRFEKGMLKESGIDAALWPIVIGVCYYNIYSEWKRK